MKKLLVLLVVLGLASFANAALTLTGIDNADGTGVVTVGIDGGTLAGMDLVVRTVPGDVGTVGAPAAIYDTSALGSWVAIGPVAGNDSDTQRYSGAAIAMFGGSPIPGPAGILMDLPMATAADSYTVELYVFAGGTDIDGGLIEAGRYGTFTITPEPMTMTLLGLGGLALLRRRR